MKIYKYELGGIPGRTVIKGPRFEALSIGFVGSRLYLWAGTPSEGDPVENVIKVCFTGDDLPIGRFIGRAEIGGFQFHAFDVTPHIPKAA